MSMARYISIAALGACVFSPEGYSGVGGAGCRVARTSTRAFPGYDRENTVRRGRIRKRQRPSQVGVAPCAAHHAAHPSIRGRATPQEDRHHEGACLMQIVRVYTGDENENYTGVVSPGIVCQLMSVG